MKLPASVLPIKLTTSGDFLLKKGSAWTKGTSLHLSKLKDDKNNSFENFYTSFLSNLCAGFIFKRFEYHALFFFQYDNVRPKVTSCIRIDTNICLQLFYDFSIYYIVPLPNGSRMIIILEIFKINQLWDLIVNTFLWIRATRFLMRLIRFA